MNFSFHLYCDIKIYTWFNSTKMCSNDFEYSRSKTLQSKYAMYDSI